MTSLLSCSVHTAQSDAQAYLAFRLAHVQSDTCTVHVGYYGIHCSGTWVHYYNLEQPMYAYANNACMHTECQILIGL